MLNDRDKFRLAAVHRAASPMSRDPVRLGVGSSTTQAPVLICGADDQEGQLLSSYFEQNGFNSVRATDADTALAMHESLEPGLVLLDIRMLGADGWRVLATVRERGKTPVILLTSGESDIENIHGLRSGADDCLANPINPAEVVARGQAVLRRSTLQRAALESSVLTVPPFEVELKVHEITVLTNTGRQRLELTATEYRLLAQLICTEGKIHSRSGLLLCFRDAHSSPRKVDLYISRVRRKLEQAGVQGMIKTVHGIGYGLVADASGQ